METFPLSFTHPEDPDLFKKSFHDDTILPSQWKDFSTSSVQRGEARLMLAVLEDAIHQWWLHNTQPGRRSQRIIRELREWFTAIDDRWLYSYQNICSHFGIEAQWFWEGLQEAKLERNIRRTSGGRRTAPLENY